MYNSCVLRPRQHSTINTHITCNIIVNIPVTFLDAPIKSSLVQLFLLVNQPTTITDPAHRPSKPMLLIQEGQVLHAKNTEHAAGAINNDQAHIK